MVGVNVFFRVTIAGNTHPVSKETLRIFILKFDHCVFEIALGSQVWGEKPMMPIFPNGVTVNADVEEALFRFFQFDDCFPRLLWSMKPLQLKAVNARINRPLRCRPGSSVQ